MDIATTTWIDEVVIPEYIAYPSGISYNSGTGETLLIDDVTDKIYSMREGQWTSINETPRLLSSITGMAVRNKYLGLIQFSTVPPTISTIVETVSI